MRISDWSSDVCSSDLIDDGLRAGLFTLDDLLGVPFVAASWEAVSTRFPDVDPRRLVLELTREQICHMVNNLISESRERIGTSGVRSEEHTSELQSLMRISYAVFCLKKKK